MAKFFGQVGFGFTHETTPGVWVDQTIEKDYFGDIQNLVNRYTEGESINDNLRLTNTISIVSDPFAYHHYQHIKYVKWLDAIWKVSSVEVKHPRLLLQISEVYNGPTA